MCGSGFWMKVVGLKPPPPPFYKFWEADVNEIVDAILKKNRRQNKKSGQDNATTKTLLGTLYLILAKCSWF